MVAGAAAFHAGVQYWTVFWGGTFGTRTHPEYDLSPVAGEQSAGVLLSREMGGYSEFQRVMTLQRLSRDRPLKHNVFAFNASRTRFFPYQFKPLLKFLESAHHRLLICDEVGLGKTIEAGLILLELRARQVMRMALVVCPSNLRPKWKFELKQRFGEDFRILGSQEMHTFLDEYEEDPERTHLSGIVSLETLRSERLRERLRETGPAFDLVIVDEAHHVRNFGTSQRDVVASIAEDAQAMVMLTATPVHLGSQNLFSLLNILDPDDFPDAASTETRFSDNEAIVRAQSAVARVPPDYEAALVSLERARSSDWFRAGGMLDAVASRVDRERSLSEASRSGRLGRAEASKIQRDLAELNLLGHILTRTRKRDVQQDVAQRRARAIEVKLSVDEQRLYDGITALITREAQRNEGRMQNLVWRLSTPQRRLASSLQGMVEFYKQMGPPSGWRRDDDDEEWQDEQSLELLENAGDLESEIVQLIRRWPSDGPDAKYDQLKALLQTLPHTGRQQKVLIFASFKHTVRYLGRRLAADGFGVRIIDGDVPIHERPAVIDEFRAAQDVQVLVSSRVGSEGLDFQFCSTLVNYDLPWNPMEVEQRIGRLDRIGQQAPTIAIINFFSKGTIEERILRRLYDRIGIFERSIGDLEAILGDVAAEIQADIVHAALNPAEADALTERVARVIETRRLAVESLEASAASFVGVDAFFDEEVAAIRERRRYVTGEQLRRFVSEFLRSEAPRTRLEYDLQEKRGVLYPDESLRHFLRRSGKVSEALALVGAVGKSIAVTFDNQVAFADGRIEFISVLHPLVQAIAEHHVSTGLRRTAYQVRVTSAQLPAGHYFFFVYKMAFRAARPRNVLEAIVIDESFREVGDDVTSEVLLGEMVERGTSVEEAVVVPEALGERAAQAGEMAMLRRRQAAIEAERRENDVFVEKRLASVRNYYEKAITKKRDLLERARREGRKENYRRMLGSVLTKLEAEYEDKLDDLERLREVSADYQEIAMGIVEICEPDRDAERAIYG